ncbi:hypothetical protein [Veronia pacifica]|uniref:Uncharacterized protein n=1 Tax=Veronia pacifica TaxID=1080227 RepID=A0A1C3ESI7_9GAMM|nr:hypothetical protein [Veronia pacifica]ODA36194.1 hypothetical protein A8L45_00900 [Veronia pacifica]
MGVAVADVDKKTSVVKDNDLTSDSIRDKRLKVSLSDGNESVAKSLDIPSEALSLLTIYANSAKPIEKPGAFIMFPNTYKPKPSPVLDGTVKAAIILEKARFYYPDMIRISLASEISTRSAEIFVIDAKSKKILLRQHMVDEYLELNTRPDWPEEIRLVADLEFPSGRDIIKADINFSVPVANLTDSANPYIDGNDAVIPLVIKTKTEGLYRVKANLFSESGRPLVSVSQLQLVDKGMATIPLKIDNEVVSSVRQGEFAFNGTNKSEYSLRNIEVEKVCPHTGRVLGFGNTFHSLEMRINIPKQLINSSKDIWLPKRRGNESEFLSAKDNGI